MTGVPPAAPAGALGAGALVAVALQDGLLSLYIAEIDIAFQQLHHRVRRELVLRNAAIPPQVETRAAARAPVGDLLRLHLAGNLRSAVVGTLLALAAAAHAVQFALKVAATLRIGSILDIALELLLIITFLDVKRRDRRTAVIPERSEAAAIELELNDVFLYHKGCNGGAVAAANRRPELLQAAGILLPIHGIVLIHAQVDALLRAGHVDLQRDLPADEVVLQGRLAASLHSKSREGKYNSNNKDSSDPAKHGRAPDDEGYSDVAERV